MSRYFDDYDGTDDLLVMDQYLEHYGRKGMHWGQHLPDILQLLMRTGRYRGKSSAQRNVIRRRRKTAKANAKYKAQVQKKRTESLAKARETAKKNAPQRKKLNDIVKNGSAADILKVANDLTPKQRQQALDQLRFKQSLNDFNEKDIAAGQAKFNSVMNKIGKVAETSGKVIDAANKGATLYNALKGEKKNTSPENQLKQLMIDNAVDIGNNAKKASGKDAGDKALQEAILRVGSSKVFEQIQNSNGGNNNNGGNKKKKK